MEAGSWIFGRTGIAPPRYSPFICVHRGLLFNTSPYRPCLLPLASCLLPLFAFQYVALPPLMS